MIAAGVLVFIIDLVRNFRVGEGGQDNPFGAGTLEFLPQDVYSTRSIPHVSSRYPLWDDPDLPRSVAAGEQYLPDAPTGGRETIVTSAIHAKPQYIVQMPGPGWTHVIAAVFTAACFLLLTVKIVVPAMLCALVAVGAVLTWVWSIDKGPDAGPVSIGGGITLPVYVTGPISHGWWAMMVLWVVAGSLFIAFVFSYLYLWTVSPEVWLAGREFLPQLGWPLGAGVLMLGAAAVMRLSRRALPSPGERNLLAPLAVLAAASLAGAGITAEIYGHWTSGLRPTASSYGAMVYLGAILTAQLVLAIAIMSGFCAARVLAGKLDRVRWASLENTSLLLYYTTAQFLIALILIHGFPHVMGGAP
jgi:cytochrome c oxidase subunit I+III